MSDENYDYDSGEHHEPVLCWGLELKYDEPADVKHPTSSIHLIVTGAIGKRTMSTFQRAEILFFENCEFTHIEDGALCSPPNLKQLIIESGNWPILTKDILKGCHKLRKFETTCTLEEDSLQELTNVVDLKLNNLPVSYLKKSFFEPFKHLESLKLDIKSELDTSQNSKSSIRISESLLDSCSNLKILHLNANWQIVMKENPFSYLLHLQELKLHNIHFGRITREFFNFAELKTLDINVGGDSIQVDADVFTSVPHLTSLTIREAALENYDLGLLYPLSVLVHLDLSNNKLTFESLKSLPELPSLETLIVGRNKILKFDLGFLKQKLPKLREICLSFISLDSEFRKELKEEQSIRIRRPFGERRYVKGWAEVQEEQKGIENLIISFEINYIFHILIKVFVKL